MENTNHISGQQKQIIDYILDGEWHCFASDSFFMKDDRTSISKLRKKGFQFESIACDKRCGKNHFSSVYMRKLLAVPYWFAWEKPAPAREGSTTDGPERISKSKEWKFRSESKPEVVYSVIDFTAYFMCNCPAYDKGHKTCWHIKQVKLMDKNNDPIPAEPITKQQTLFA